MFKKFELKKDSSQVESFEFQKFGLKVTRSAEKYEQKILTEKKDFEINKNSSQRAGVSYLKEKRIEDFIATEVEARLTEEKNKIFDEYKSKGFEEGKAEGLQTEKDKILSEYKDRIEESYTSLQALITELSQLRELILKETELDIMQLIKLYSEKISLKSIELDENHAKNLISSLFKQYPSMEEFSFTVSKHDEQNFKFILDEINNTHLSKKIKLIVDPNLEEGALLVKTEDGLVDMSLQERFQRVWKAVS